ncbi:MAG: sigma-70 family RNA polymerase sigma factor [Alphaproteobacteria bacterium]|nr:sigma-70 family RNA polymerase sigma factor [Alphaproteobacteria bacterium]
MTDVAAFKAEMIALVPNLRAFARSLCGTPDWADDLVQETLTRAWANRDSFNQGTNMKAWLFTILRNFFFNELRKKKRIVELNRDGMEIEPGVHETQPSKLHLNDLARELAKLTADQREALMLVSVDGFSYEEAAAICGCAVGTIKSRVSRARRELEAKLGGGGRYRNGCGGCDPAGFHGRTLPGGFQVAGPIGTWRGVESRA